MLTDEEEWSWRRKGDPVLHIELRRAADLLLVCPASADTMAKISLGIADSLFLCIVRAWDFSKPAILCPAMNTLMYEHALTRAQEEALTKMGFSLISPVSKRLACDDVGKGALAEVGDIIEVVETALHTLPLNSNPREGNNFPSASINRLRLTVDKRRANTYYICAAFLTGASLGFITTVFLSHRKAR